MIKNLLAIIIFILAAFSVLSAEAATLYFQPEHLEIGVGETAKVDLILDSQENINAIEGTLDFSKDLFEIEDFNDGNTIINLWITKPQLKEGDILFSGIIPGGYFASKGKIFSIELTAKKAGRTVFHLRDSRVLLNDGFGTPVFLETKSLSIAILSKPTGLTISKTEDKDTPEDFQLLIDKNPEIFKGKFFLAFATQDKGLGIDHYEIKERRESKIFGMTLRMPKKWQIAESPYVLKDQKLRSFVYVKAIDKAGNERIAVVEQRYPIKWYEYPLTWIIIILGLSIAYLVKRILWRK